MKLPELIPAPTHKGVAVVRPAHREGERLLEERLGISGRGWAMKTPSFSRLSGTCRVIPEASLSAPELLHALTPGAEGLP